MAGLRYFDDEHERKMREIIQYYLANHIGEEDQKLAKECLEEMKPFYDGRL